MASTWKRLLSKTRGNDDDRGSYSRPRDGSSSSSSSGWSTSSTGPEPAQRSSSWLQKKASKFADATAMTSEPGSKRRRAKLSKSLIRSKPYSSLPSSWLHHETADLPVHTRRGGGADWSFTALDDESTSEDEILAPASRKAGKEKTAVAESSSHARQRNVDDSPQTTQLNQQRTWSSNGSDYWNRLYGSRPEHSPAVDTEPQDDQASSSSEEEHWWSGEEGEENEQTQTADVTTPTVTEEVQSGRANDLDVSGGVDLVSTAIQRTTSEPEIDDLVEGWPLPDHTNDDLAFRTREQPLETRLEAATGSVWLFRCNVCAVPITDTHFHCSLCNEGEYDLCGDRVASGTMCPGHGHWLIKRSIRDGTVINSTTERLAPRIRYPVSTLEEAVPNEIPGFTANDGELQRVHTDESSSSSSGAIESTNLEDAAREIDDQVTEVLARASRRLEDQSPTSAANEQHEQDQQYASLLREEMEREFGSLGIWIFDEIREQLVLIAEPSPLPEAERTEEQDRQLALQIQEEMASADRRSSTAAAQQEEMDRQHALQLQEAMDLEQDEQQRQLETDPMRDCTVCAESKPSSHFPITSPTERCQHPPNLCRECLQSWMSSELDTKGCSNFKCPECPERMDFEDVREAASEETFAAYDKLAMRSALGSLEEFAWCLRSSCGNGQLNIDNDHYMICQACGYRQCLKHKTQWHHGETCEEYDYRVSGRKAADEARERQRAEDRSRREEERRQREKANEERKTEAMIGTVSKLCPGKCGWRIQRNKGCDHMTCRRCGHEFCWECLAPQERIDRVGNTAHERHCKNHSDNLRT